MGETRSARMTRLNHERTKHGYSRRGSEVVEFRIWRHMIKRCTDKKHKSFKYYGGRGIRVCAAWLESFEQFLADVGRRPSKDLSLERVENDVGYEPGNVVWGTSRDQARNRRNNVRHLYDGVQRTIAEIADLTGVQRHLLYDRVRRGWPIADAVISPPDRGRRLMPSQIR